jgi:short-chain fatty acids transporter
VTATLSHPFNRVYMLVIGATGLFAAVALHPRRDAVTLSPEQVEAIMPTPPEATGTPDTPAEKMESFRGWVWFAALLLAYPLGHSIVTRGFGTSWTINAYNAVFLVTALLLHGNPASFLRACRNGVDAAWGIIIQFPFYAGIFGLMQNTALGAWIGEGFANFATEGTYPFVVYFYSGLMNLFVPSAGSKWLIEAPYLVAAGETLDVSVVTVLLAYAYGDSTTNLIQPFFTIPILAVTRLRFGDVVGYTFLVAVACFAVSAVAMAWIPPRL